MYQEGHIDKSTAEYLLPPSMVRTQEMYFLKTIHKNPPSVSRAGGKGMAGTAMAVPVFEGVKMASLGF